MSAIVGGNRPGFTLLSITTRNQLLNSEADVKNKIWSLWLVASAGLVACDSGVFYAKFECSSPGQQHVATFFVNSGGGAAGWQVEKVNVRRTDEVIDFEEFSFSMSHGYDLAIKWNDDLSLSVYYPHGADIDLAQSIVYGSDQSPNYDEILDVRYFGVDAKEGFFVNHETGCLS